MNPTAEAELVPARRAWSPEYAERQAMEMAWVRCELPTEVLQARRALLAVEELAATLEEGAVLIDEMVATGTLPARFGRRR